VRSVAWMEPEHQECPDCGGVRHMVNGEVLDDSGATTVAVFLAFLYDHGGVREAFVDLVLGPWGEAADPAERLTFSTRTGPVVGGRVASTLLDAPATAPDDPQLGRRVSRDEGLAHPAIATVWACSDAVLSDVPAVRDHLAGTRRRGWPWQRG